MLLFGGMYFGTGFQGVADTLLAFACGSDARRLFPVSRRSGIVPHFLRQRRDLRFRGDQTLLQRRLPAERRRAGTGAHTHAILSHTLQRHRSDKHQLCDLLRQQPVQHLGVINAEVRQGVIVHRHVTTNPLKRQMELTLPPWRVGGR